MKIQKIEKINVKYRHLKMTDISVKDDETFWVSTNNKDWVLTHNTSWPDIDCLSSEHVIQMHDMSYKALKDIEVNDQIITPSGDIESVTFVKHRMSTEDDIIYTVLVKLGTTYGTIVANHKHKFVTSDNEHVLAKDLTIGTMLLSKDGSAEIVDISTSNDVIMLTDISISPNHLFNVVPFDVVEYSKNFDQNLLCVNIYIKDSDVEEIMKYVQEDINQ